MKERIALAIAICWTLFIIVAIFLPGQYVPQEPALRFDKVIHVGLFFGFALLWTLVFARGMLGRASVILGIAIVFAFFAEWLQGALPLGRTTDPYDVVANVMGSFLGWLAWLVVGRHWFRPGKHGT